jgi:hypothetical protein
MLTCSHGKMKFETVKRPFVIESLRDTGAYILPGVAFANTNLFLRIGRLDELFVKIPSPRGFSDYRRFIRYEETNPEDLRPLEDAERFTNLRRTIDAFPDPLHWRELDPEIAHYLVVHKLQHERLRRQEAVRVPKVKFGMLSFSRFPLFRKVYPALFQQRVAGTTLWDMFDFSARRIRPRWQPFWPVISAQLSNLLDCGLISHIDWNIQNFLFNDIDQQLYYVDLKPTTFVARSSNEHNLRGIRSEFIV